MNTNNDSNHRTKTIRKQFAILAVVLLAGVPLMEISTPPASACSACATNGVIKLPETSEGILKALDEHDAVLNEVIRAKRLNRVSLLVLGMGQLAKGLIDKAPALKKTAVQDSVTQFRKPARDLLKSALTENYAEARLNFRKFEEALKNLEAHFQSHSK